MKTFRLLVASLAASLASLAFSATTTPISLLNPSGSIAGQAIISTGGSSAPVWGPVPLTGITGTLAIANGGTGATSASAARTNLGLGTSATVNTGASGATVPLLNGANTWAAAQTFSVRPTFNGATPWDSANLASPASTVGVTNGGNAAAGAIGEYKSSDVPIGSPVALTAGTAANITSVSLTAGDWLCSGTATFLQTGTTGVTTIAAGMNTTSATMPLTEQQGYAALNLTFATGSAYANAITVGNWRYNVTTTTTVYLVAKASFTSSTESAYGFIGCYRFR
ncbi:putative membrane-localized protein [Burkholderia sp. YI23]|nr:putative membrane-localized protein [Burkholderia sp. YI23]